MPQPSIARIESGAVSPRVDNLERLLHTCGQELEPVGVAGDDDLDWTLIDGMLELTPAERGQHAASSARSAHRLVRTARPGEPDDPPLEPDAALAALAGHEVEFVLIGSYAAAVVGSPVVPSDVEICPALGRTNLERLAAACEELEAQLRSPWIGGRSISALGDGGLVFALTDGRVDPWERMSYATTAGTLLVSARPPGTGGHRDLAARATSCGLGRSPIEVASIDDLIRICSSIGRPENLIAALYLRAVRKDLRWSAQ